ncbi:MAG TPA: universal stress protein [Acidimicrobiia bacterium]|nr:universal stress protein [Acidimicrobiia bacterium]
MNRILLAIDGSDHSERAALLAGELSGGMDAPVDVVNVVSESSLVTAGPIHDYARIEKTAISQRELLKSLGADLVVQAANRVREAGGDVDNTDVLIGSPAHEIVRYAEDREADCIVMGRRGLGDVGGILMGSVSHKVGHLTERTLVTTE